MTTTDDKGHVEEEEDDGPAGFPADPGRLWLSVERDWRWIPIAGAMWGALGLLVAFVFIKHTFQSEAVLVWQASADGRNDERELGRSIELPGTLKRVQERLELDFTVKTLDQQIDVWLDGNLARVFARGPSEQSAMLLANTIADVFLEQQRNVVRARAEEAARALEKDVAAARAKLAQSRKAFDAFRSENGVTDIERETQLAIENAARLKQQQQQARADATTLEARVSGLGTESRKQHRTTVQAASSTNPYAQKVAELRTELAAARVRYSPEHPRIASLETQLAALEAHATKNKAVVSSVTTVANPEYQSLQTSLFASRAEQEAAAKRVQSFEQFAQGADERLAALTVLQGRAQSFQADIDLVQKRVTELETQLSEATDAVRTPQVQWRVLIRATKAEWPERSKRRLIVAGMPLGGILAALLALLLRPLLDGRVYTAREARYWARLPVLGSFAWPRNRAMFFTFADELGEHCTAARGYTLVVGMSGREKALAEELADWLGAERTPVGVSHRGPQIREPGRALGDNASFHSTPVAGTALMPIRRQSGPVVGPQGAHGTHAWLGATKGPALRRAVRMADRVIVLLTSGGELFTSVAGLRARLGRSTGVAVVLLGLSPELLNLPDQVGDAEGFWHATKPRSSREDA